MTMPNGLSNWTAEAEAAITVLLTEAEAKGHWLWQRYYDLWISPAELRNAMAEGRYRWGAVNWEIRDPQEALAALDTRIGDLQQERTRLEERLRA